MALETIREPYEILIRWRNGQISGLHKRELITVKDGEVTLSVSEGKPVPIEAAGVPDFMSPQDAIATASRLLTEDNGKDTRILELEKANEEKDNLIANLVEQIDSLTAKAAVS